MIRLHLRSLAALAADAVGELVGALVFLSMRKRGAK